MIAFNAFGHLFLGFLVMPFVAVSPLECIAVVIGSLLPDIDHPKSTLGRYNPLAKNMKHRGHAHSLMGIILLCIPFIFLGDSIYLCAFYGALSHLIGDMIQSKFKHSHYKIKLW